MFDEDPKTINSVIENRIVKRDEHGKSNILAALFGIPIGILFFVPIFLGTGSASDYILSTFALIFIYAIFSLSLNLEVGYLGLPNFGKVAFVAVGGYTFAILESNGMFNIWINVIWSIIATCLFGVVLTLPSLRLKEDYFAIATIVAGEIVRITVNNEAVFGGFSGIKVLNPIFVAYDPDEFMTHFFINIVTFAFALLVLGATYGTYRIRKQKMMEVYSEKKAELKAFEEAEKVAVVLMVLGFGLNFIRAFDSSPSIGLDLFLMLLVLTLRSKILFSGKSISELPEMFFIMPGVAALLLFLGSFFCDPVTTVSTPQWYNTLLAFSALILIYAVIQSIDASPLGRTLKAIREDDTSAISVGKSLLIFRLKGLILASAMVGLAAPLFVFQLTGVTPLTFLPLLTFTLYTMVIVGGTANNKGVIFGAILFQILQQATAKLSNLKLQYPWGSPVRPENWALIITGVLLIVFLIYAPEGIFPEKRYNNERYYDMLHYADKVDDIETNALLKLIAQGAKSPLLDGGDKE